MTDATPEDARPHRESAGAPRPCDNNATGSTSAAAVLSAAAVPRSPRAAATRSAEEEGCLRLLRQGRRSPTSRRR